jgi:hypothetical protein
MARRPKAETRMRRAVDSKDPYQFAWALLDIARRDWADNQSFSVLSVTDIKNLLQAIMTAQPQNESQEESKTATITQIKDFLKK